MARHGNTEGGAEATRLAQDLAEDLRLLLSLDLSPAARTIASRALDRAGALAQSLGTAARPVLDDQVFLALLETAGAETALELLDQVLLDLATIERNLHRNMAATNWQGLRVDTHNLMSISGSLGAKGLYHAALTLNNLAHGESGSDIARMLPEAFEMMAELKALVQREREMRRHGEASGRPLLPPKEG